MNTLKSCGKGKPQHGGLDYTSLSGSADERAVYQFPCAPRTSQAALEKGSECCPVAPARKTLNFCELETMQGGGEPFVVRGSHGM